MSMSSPTTHAKAKPLLSDTTYSRLKKSATIVLPAISAFYIALAQIWHFPHVEEVAGSLTALNTLIGVLIQISKKSYYASGLQYDGVMNVTESPTKTTVSLQLHEDAEDIVSKNEVTFKVNADTGENPIVQP